jgi:hypothetical protein
LVEPVSSETRIVAARRRAGTAKLVLGGLAAVAFVASAALARAAYPGHHKKGTTALSPPKRFVQIVRQNQLESGILAPTEADPSVATAQS